MLANGCAVSHLCDQTNSALLELRIQRALSTIDIPVPLEKMLDRYTQLLQDNEVVITYFLVSESQSLGEQFLGGAFNVVPIFT